jgi:hypothetical protein
VLERRYSITAELFEVLSPPPGTSGEEQLKRIGELRQRADPEIQDMTGSWKFKIRQSG